MTTLIDGNVHAAALRARTKVRAEAFAQAHGPCAASSTSSSSAIIPASRAYVSTKTKMAHETAIDGRLIELPEDIARDALLAEIDRLNRDPMVDGILVQLPLPGHLDGR